MGQLVLPYGDERVLVQDSAITLIEMKPSSSQTWVTHYSGPAIPQLYVYPQVNEPWDYRVNGNQIGTSVTLPIYCDTWGLFLTDVVDPANLHLELGLYDQNTGTQAEYMSVSKAIIPMGATFPKDFPSRARYRQWNNSFDWDVPAEEVLGNGTIVDKSVMMDAFRTMAPNRYVTTLWRDARGLMTWVKILAAKEWIGEDSGWVVEMTIEERQPPAMPLTSLT